MSSALAMFVLLSCVSLAFVGFAWFTAHRLRPDDQLPADWRWLVPWAVKGLGVPMALWAVMNFGVSQSLQPFMPQVQAARNSGTVWVPPFLSVTAAGWFAISSYWCAVTMGWILFRAGANLEGEVRSDFRNLCLTSLAGMFLPALVIFLAGGWMTLGLAAAAILAPVAGYAPAVFHPTKAPPMYARAVAKMKFGKYADAEWAILQELEKCENDFDGWMMLADLYATRFNDLPEAEQTVLEICDQPRTNASQVSVALHKLADWQLNLANDPDAARRALQVICDRLPGTHMAHMAQLRASQLPRTAEDLREQRRGHTIALPAFSGNLDATPTQPAVAPDPGQAGELARTLTAKLAREPNDVASRERLARLLADQLGKVDQAFEQVEVLLALPGQSDGKRAEWLSYLATWQLRHKHDVQAARPVLERLIREFPKTPQALAAQGRLAQIEAEERQRQLKPPAIKIKITPEAPA